MYELGGESYIFPVSNEKHDVRRTLNEWEYQGNMYDIEIADEDCEICDHQNIRYQFEIVNIYNDNILLIGSECINRFKIGVINESGERLPFDDAKRKVNKDRNKLITEAKEKSVINSLIKLSVVDEDFKIEEFIKYYKERKAFTPNQLSLLIWRFFV